MIRRDILAMIREKKTADHQFVRWWRKEEDFLDYDLADRFMENLSSSEEIGGVDLLTTDDMWKEVQRVAGPRVKRVKDVKGDRVEWVHQGKQGEHKEICIFCPETLLSIYDVETRGNPVDS